MTRCIWKCFPAVLFSRVGWRIGLCLALHLGLSGWLGSRRTCTPPAGLTVGGVVAT